MLKIKKKTMRNLKYDYKKSEAYPNSNGLKVFGTFVCGGGSTMGYKLAGYDHLGGVEIDQRMAEIYKKNHAPRYFYLEVLSYNEIESRTGLNRGLVKRYLTLEVMPSLDKACKIAEALGYKLQLVADD